MNTETIRNKLKEARTEAARLIAQNQELSRQLDDTLLQMHINAGKIQMLNELLETMEGGEKVEKNSD